MAGLTSRYELSKPLNDKLVDVALDIQALTTEIYWRSIMKQLPGLPVRRTKTVMRVAANLSPNTGLPKIAQRLAELATQGITTTDVTYDENTGEFNFHSAPEFFREPAQAHE